jgi:nucleoside-diphosphate-sugar epimerase
VFVAGGTGVVGRRLVPQLVARGHQVAATTTSPDKFPLLERLGAEALLMDGLDGASVGEAVARATPDVIVHEMTAIAPGHAGKPDMKHFDQWFAPTIRLRTEGTDHLLAAGRAVGIKRFVAQSYAGWPFARTGGPVKTEEDELDPAPPDALRDGLDAIRYLEAAVTGATWTEGVVLRYGGFYGPGTGMSRGGKQAQLIEKRKWPVVGDGGGVWSFVQIEDAATGTVEAIEHGSPGVYNVVDDDPAPVREWLPALAAALGARKPMRLPRWLGRIAAGEAGVVMMTEVRGASNAKAKRELGWQLRYPSWRQGFAEGLG